MFNLTRSFYNDLIAMANDPYFGTAILDFSLTELAEAGFKGALEPEILESRDHPQRFLGTHKYLNFPQHPDFGAMLTTARSGDAALLVFVGSFAPYHRGHLAAMAAADLAVRERGLVPIAGVFSPHSEEEVISKIVPRHPDALIATAAREAEFRERLDSHLPTGTPLMVDLWNAYLPGRTRAFTDILLRAERTMVAFNLLGVEVVYVLGGDNAASLRAFSRHGHVVCVRRPGYEDATTQFEQNRRLRSGFREGRIIVTSRKDQTIISSTDLRNAG